MKKYGYFSKDGYHITTRATPRHWYNYLYNDEYITFVSQVGFGQGLAQDDMGRRLQIVDDRNVFLVESDDFWSVLGLPVYDDVQRYDCLHAIGYTEITLQKNDIEARSRFFVPRVGKQEYLSVILTNHSSEVRTLKLIPYYATAIDGRYTPQGDETDCAGFYEDKNAVIGMGYKAFGSSKITRRCAYLLASDTVTGFDSRHSAFIGAYGIKQQPKALVEHHGCSNSDCIAEKICLALENTVTLSPSESKTFHYAVGTEDTPERIMQFSPAEIEYQFTETKAYYAGLLGQVSVKTPWDDLNHLFNDWLKYQADMGARWARVHHTEYRALASDTECLSSIDAVLAAERLCRILSYQYATGCAPRMVPNGNDKTASDSTVWPVFAVYAITQELGELDFLNRIVPFYDGGEGSVYEHVRRSVDFLWEFTGHFRLIKIGESDRDGGLNRAGVPEKGVSIWLSLAFIRAAKMLEQMANWLGKEGDSKNAARYAAEMTERVNRYGWDGDRYIYAISDDQEKIGSKKNAEGSIFALPQLWSVLAGLDETHTAAAMETLEQELNMGAGLLISKPPYTNDLPYIGRIARKYPGLQENGGICLQASAWKLAVDCLLRRPQKVEEGLEKILPEHHRYGITYGEPYIMYNSYLSEQTGYRAGTPGQSWRNAAGPWLMYALVRFIYGFCPEFGGARIAPCLPPKWRECTLKKMFRGCRYNIHYIQEGLHPQSEVSRIIVNDRDVPIDRPIRPIAGKTLNIEVRLK